VERSSSVVKKVWDTCCKEKKTLKKKKKKGFRVALKTICVISITFNSVWFYTSTKSLPQ